MNGKALAKIFVEFVGTAVLTMAVLSINRYGIPLFTAIVAGVTLGTMVVALGPVSGGHFNPSITAGMLMIRKINLTNAIAYVVAQGLGGVAAWQLYEWFTGKSISNNATEAFDWKIFTAEVIGTFIFSACVAAAVSRRHEGTDRGLLVGSGLFIGATVASIAAAGFLNPAVALGVRNFSLEYAFGPVLGAVLGIGIYEMYLNDRLAGLVAKPAVKAEVAAPAKKVAARKATAKKKTTKKRA